MQEHIAKRKEKCSLSHDDTSLKDINEFQSPPRVRTRERPKNRLGSNAEKHIANYTKKKKALSEVKVVFFKHEKLSLCMALHSNSSHYHGHIMNYQFIDSRE
ncbi:hypothetical protein Ahy_Scaffold5g107803 isoform C [Arachis hypogaea]|uniref:Uncharacterized protein n=1 Tax=Arachis hypogaea TaxID=3818 RepID=A0A444WQ80_ARAHY|nr:hypothetical protein Ahy_Scaffold5g107803 isoform C [Arachis hypogaea]